MLAHPTNFGLVVSLKAAEAFGLTIPPNFSTAPIK